MSRKCGVKCNKMPSRSSTCQKR